MKKIDEITEKINGDFFLEISFFIGMLEKIFDPKNLRSRRKYEYFRKIIFRITAKEPVLIVFDDTKSPLMSYGSVILGLEELISMYKDGVFCEELQKICDYLHQKNEEFSPCSKMEHTADFEIKQKKQDFIYQTKKGKKLVNLKAIARKFEIEGKPEFKEALKDGKAKRFDTYRFDGVHGEFIEAEKALHVLNIYKHYSKNEQLNKIIEEIIEFYKEKDKKQQDFLEKYKNNL